MQRTEARVHPINHIAVRNLAMQIIHRKLYLLSLG